MQATYKEQSLLKSYNIYKLKYTKTVINNYIRTFPCIQSTVMKESKHIDLLPMQTIIIKTAFTVLYSHVSDFYKK